MSTLQQVLALIAETLGGLYLGICILRFLLQASRADYYNPISQFVVKATAVPVKLLRKAVPSVGRVDGSALVWALLVAVLIIESLALVRAGVLISPLTALAWAAISLINLTLTLYYYGLMIVIIVSFLVVLGGLNISHPAFDLINQLMRPIMLPFSQLLPPMGGIDLSPILMFLAIRVLQVLVTNLAIAAGLVPAVVPGF